MGRGVEGAGVALAPHDVAAGAHGAGDQAQLTVASLDCALAGDQDVLPEVVLALGEVVMALDALHFLEVAAAVLEDLDDALHHLLAVEQGEFLGPVQVGHVVVEFGGVLHQVGQVGVGQVDVPLLHQLLGDGDMVGGDAVADAARAGVEEGPGVVLLVQHDFDEVVAGAQGTQLVAPVFGEVVVEVQATQLGGFGLQLLDARAGGLLDAAVVVAGAEGYLALDGPADVGQVVGQILALQRRLDGDHAAADVHAHGGGNDGAHGRNDRADGCAQTEVAVGHDRDVLVDKGHLRQVFNLSHRRLLDLLGGEPGQDAGADVGRGHGWPPARRDGVQVALFQYSNPLRFGSGAFPK